MMMTKQLILSILLLLGLGSVACELKEPCDPGDRYENGICIPGAMGGAEGGACMDPGEGLGGDAPDDQPPNVGAPCECPEQCFGGTECGHPQLSQCVALCGGGDPFENACPDGLTCTNFGEASVCF